MNLINDNAIKPKNGELLIAYAEQMKVALNCLNELNKHIDEILQLHKGDQ